jgi:hypothetical protein
MNLNKFQVQRDFIFEKIYIKKLYKSYLKTSSKKHKFLN